MNRCRCSLCTSRYGIFLTNDKGFWALCRKCEFLVKTFLEDLKGRVWYTTDLKKWIDEKFNYGNTAYQIIEWCIAHDRWLPKLQAEEEVEWIKIHG